MTAECNETNSCINVNWVRAHFAEFQSAESRYKKPFGPFVHEINKGILTLPLKISNPGQDYNVAFPYRTRIIIKPFS